MIVLTYEILQQILHCRELEETSRKFNDAFNSINDQLKKKNEPENMLDLLICQQTVTSLSLEYDDAYKNALVDLGMMVVKEFSTGAGDSSPMPSRK